MYGKLMVMVQRRKCILTVLYIIDRKYDDYLVKQVSMHKSKWKYSIIDIVIEPCGDMEEI